MQDYIFKKMKPVDNEKNIEQNPKLVSMLSIFWSFIGSVFMLSLVTSVLWIIYNNCIIQYFPFLPPLNFIKVFMIFLFYHIINLSIFTFIVSFANLIKKEK